MPRPDLHRIKAPNPKLQTPKKHQAPGTKQRLVGLPALRSDLSAKRLEFNVWSLSLELDVRFLEFVWSLGFGAWDFAAFGAWIFFFGAFTLLFPLPSPSTLQ